jgi:uncharacterized protein (TIGR02099 family)
MLKSSLSLAWRSLGRLSRIVLELSLLLVITGVVLLLVLRYKILPEVERYHDSITTAASAAIGQPLNIGKIAVDWDGLRLRLLLSDVRILDKQGQVALNLPRLENTVAWTSLPAAELRFHSLLIDSPELSVKRDVQGHWYVAGIALEAQSTGRQDGSDWLLHQARIVIRNGRITWKDDFHAAPTLVLEQVDLSIENSHDRHRIALRASPPDRLASRLDIRGNFYGNSFADIGEWHGQLYTQLDYADVLSWKPWVALPDMFKRGKGALRMWLDFEKGRVHSFDADVALAGVQARLSEGLPQLDLRELRGRVGWHELERGFEITTKRLALQMRDGLKLNPTDFHLRLSGGKNTKLASGEIRANVLELADLGILSSYLPLADNLKKQIADAAPQGRVTGLNARWQGSVGDIARYQIKARFNELSLRRVGEMPGFSGLSGEVDGIDASGTLTLDSRNFKLDAPQLFAEPVEFDTLVARLGWYRNSRGLEIKASNVELANADLAGTIYGSYQSEAEGAGSVDATIDMKRVAVRHAGRYTPVSAVNKETRNWLQAALQGGEADSFRVRLRGDLREFPFVGNEHGIFRIEARAKDVVMEFAKGWPRIEDAQTHLLIQGNKLDIDAETATTTGAHLQNVKVSIPDLLDSKLLLQVRGEAVDATQRCLDYIRKSPVNGYLDGFTEGVTARGDGKLNLQIDIPLNGDVPVKVRGDYHFADNDVDFGKNIPLLREVNGVLLFTEASVNADDIGVQMLGNTAHLTVQGEKGSLLAKASGRFDLDYLNKVELHPLWGRVHGWADWSASISMKGNLLDVVVDSELQGIDLNLPQPFAKNAGERIPIHFELTSINRYKEVLSLRYGPLFDAKLVRQLGTDGIWGIQRGHIMFGGNALQSGKDGIWVAGELPQVSLQGWNDLGLASGREGVLPDIEGIDVTVGQLTGYGNTVNALSIKGSGRNGLFSMRLASREMNGDLIWQPQGNGKLLGRFKNVMLGERHGDPVPAAETVPVKSEAPDNTSFPAVDVTVEKLTYKGRQLGRLEVELNEADGNVQLERLRLVNPDGVLKMSGKWQAMPERTQLDLRVDISDAGNILSRSGYPNRLKGGNGSLESGLYWTGAPDTFAYSKLNGTVRLKVGKGRFLKVDPGAGKLLSVLSLQRIPFDFSDVFSEGFQFESITGNAQVVNGLMLTSDMKLTGAAAKATLSGQVDLNRETQDLKVRILPTVGDNVSLLSFAAGPAVGVGVLLANKILNDPLDKLTSFEYNVSGSWADPKVEKVGQPKSSQSKAGEKETPNNP